jgi:hypothetical protein
MKKYIAVLITIPLAWAGSAAWAGKVDAWRQRTAADFEKGQFKRTVTSDRGQIRLSRELTPWCDLGAAYVWDLAQDKAGNVYAATGDQGRIFKVTPDGKSSVLYDSDEQHIFSIVATDDGTVFAGTGPGGLVLKIAPDGKATTLSKTGKNYVWDLLRDPKGDIYAATGPKGEIFRIESDGKIKSVYAAKQNHILTLALAKDGTLYAGSDGEGLVYRLTAEGKAFVVYDASQDEVRALLATDDGTLYVGTSSPPPQMPGTRPAGLPMPPTSPAPTGASGPGGAFGNDDVAASAAGSSDRAAVPVQNQPPGASTRPPSDGSPSPSSLFARSNPGQNSVYRIGSDGSVREIFQERVLILSLARRDQQLLVGTGQAGQLFELNDRVPERSEVARLNHGVILSLLRRGDGSVVLGAGDPGRLYVMPGGYTATGTFLSQVFDATMISRWGALRWDAETPEGTKVTFAVRSGNVRTPDETWSDWSPEQLDAQTAVVPCPPARFLQFRATLESARPEVTPVLDHVMVRYMTTNQPPEITRIDVPDVGEGDGSVRQSKLKVRWDARDPNNDELEFALQFRKQGWKTWVKLADKQTKREFDWDIDAVPDGLYEIRVEASDRADNPADSVLTASRVSRAFVVDHTPPAVTPKVAAAKPSETTFEVAGSDSLTRLVGASYSIDSGEWTKVFPIDRIFDSRGESFRFTPPDLKPGTHLVMVRLVDAAGNVGTGDLVFVVDEPVAAK